MEKINKGWKSFDLVGGILLVNWGEKKQGRGGVVRAFEDDKEKGYGF